MKVTGQQVVDGTLPYSFYLTYCLCCFPKTFWWIFYSVTSSGGSEIFIFLLAFFPRFTISAKFPAKRYGSQWWRENFLKVVKCFTVSGMILEYLHHPVLLQVRIRSNCRSYQPQYGIFFLFLLSREMWIFHLWFLFGISKLPDFIILALWFLRFFSGFGQE